MLRKIVIAFAVMAAIGIAAAPTNASAAWHNHSGWHGGGHGGWGGGWRGGWGGGWRGPGWGFYGNPYAYGPGPYYGGGGCYRTVRVGTPYGPRWRRVWVCG